MHTDSVIAKGLIAKLQHAEYQRNKHRDLHKKRPRTEEKMLQFSI